MNMAVNQTVGAIGRDSLVRFPNPLYDDILTAPGASEEKLSALGAFVPPADFEVSWESDLGQPAWTQGTSAHTRVCWMLVTIDPDNLFPVHP